jgi:hypothetical protein
MRGGRTGRTGRALPLNPTETAVKRLDSNREDSILEPLQIFPFRSLFELSSEFAKERADLSGE